MSSERKNREKNGIWSLRVYLFAAYAGMTVIMSYLPVFFQHVGLSSSQIGLLMAVGPLASIFSQPAWGFLSDKYQTIKRMLSLAIVGLLFSAGLFMFVSGFTAYLVLVFLTFLFMSPSTALADSLAARTANAHHISFGSIRLWGSLGFGFASLTVGVFLDSVGISYLFAALAFFAFWSLIFSHFLVDLPIAGKVVTLKSVFTSGIIRVLALFLLLVAFVSLTHRANDIYLGLYIVELGGSESLIGTAWFIGVVTEALMLALSFLWFRRFHPLVFLIIACFIYAIRWMFMANATSPEMLLLIQCLHGVSFAMFYVSAIQFVTKIIPDHLQATGHMLYLTTFFGVSGMIGSLLGGWWIDQFGMASLYTGMAISAAIAGLSIFVAKGRLLQTEAEMS
ncbi:MFS transporter [Shouchella lonarensis]|uniref:Major facilitator superfamily (MFS) profile domain-containing protein n=1 Tax=Shouchella lonarensis TaxID=1464122 RepID=A0A1G6HBT8_9BACI|nr:MFS transporter [Shouchella lonarensis]SDB91742.1 MFS transporter, PPP family, 3-phenylpropionic acid transporter/hypothetical protein [Shouchella lonarensis]